jgi:protein-disulfide isomerase
MFSDFQWPFCSSGSQFIEDEILPDNVGKVRLVVRQHPLPSHNWARQAAEVAICVQQLQGSGVYRKLHRYLFAHQSEITEPSLMSTTLDFLESTSGFDPLTLHGCLASPFPSQVLLDDENIGEALGIVSTPTFFVNGQKQVGVADREALRVLIKQYTAAAAIAKP